MKLSHNSTTVKRRYSYISIKKRETLVRQVLQYGKPLSQISKRLNIRLSTAKLIIKKFKLHGRFFMKKRHFRKLNHINIIQELESSADGKQDIIKEEELNSPKDQLLQSYTWLQGLEWMNQPYSFAIVYFYQQSCMPEWSVCPIRIQFICNDRNQFQHVNND